MTHCTCFDYSPIQEILVKIVSKWNGSYILGDSYAHVYMNAIHKYIHILILMKTLGFSEMVITLFMLQWHFRYAYIYLHNSYESNYLQMKYGSQWMSLHVNYGTLSFINAILFLVIIV